MSQLSLLLQSKLQNLKLKKSQSAQWISEVREHPAWLEIKAKDRSEQIDNLVLVCYLFQRKPEPTSQRNYNRVAAMVGVLLSTDYGLFDYPKSPCLVKYPDAVVCTCGTVLGTGAGWGLLKHCHNCETPHSSRFFVEMFPSGVERFPGIASRQWCEWAQVQAILLRNSHSARPPCNSTQAIP